MKLKWRTCGEGKNEGGKGEGEKKTKEVSYHYFHIPNKNIFSISLQHSTATLRTGRRYD